MSDKEIEVTVIKKFCKGCGLCVEFCPQGKFYINPEPDKRGIQTAEVHEEIDCTGCLKCSTICPDAAIDIRRLLTTQSGDEQ